MKLNATMSDLNYSESAGRLCHLTTCFAISLHWFDMYRTLFKTTVSMHLVLIILAQFAEQYS